jgi:hypothetical protein
MLLPLDNCWTDEIWRSPYRLRFELNTGGAFVSMFTIAYGRARQLARAALQLDQPLAIVADYPSPFWIITPDSRLSPDTSVFELLNEMGVSTNPAEATWESPFYPPDESDDEGSLCEHRAVRVDWEEADILLWNNIAQGIGVEPRAPVQSKLADPENGIVVHAYDDRGMDITALSSKPIEHLYRQFDAWLLDYDRPRMADVFGPRAIDG